MFPVFLHLFLTPCRRVYVVFNVKPRSNRGLLGLALVRYFRPAALKSVHTTPTVVA